MNDYSLYLVTSSDNLPPGATVESTVREAVRAGVKIVQLREKNLSTRLFLERARALREICQPPVKLIINDRIDIAHACGADGVHLGQDDMPLLDAQKIFRVGEIIGISVNTIDEALAAVKAGADYLGVGTCWATGTKSIPSHKIIGPRGVKAIRDELDRLNLLTPLVVIGGINSTNLIRTLYGCTSNQFYYARRAESPIGVAVVSAIMSSPDPYRATQKLQNMIQEFEAWLRTPEGPFLDPDVTLKLNLAASMIKFHEKTSTPLVHHITNTVVQNDCANLALAYGCSPIMSSNLGEMEDLIKLKAGSLVLNLGTFDDNQVQAMKLAGRHANLTGKPVIFDPVGVGASQERKNKANEILNAVQMSVIKGNQAEIASLARFNSSGTSSCGVDSNGEVEAPDVLVKNLARQELCIVVMTGKTDWISDGMHVVRLQNGVSELASITGSGCMTGTSIGCFASMIQPEVDKDTQSGLLMNLKSMHQDFGGDTLIASILGISTINVVAELIHQSENEKSDFGPNNLKMRILDRICSSRRMEPFWKRINAEINISSEFFHSDAENNFPPPSRDAAMES
ncbi:hypothetical protein MJO28_015150 [Puccinia striiformis f. sp. tritici]|uniref:Uncharacterized protein n=1 Tax=Puccinia striiformis f. sp. tritici TaxID=168172 RepID=A0ACC0DS58_9BASI|nr:hypothetical protein Pst134EB_028521 [Puccinia striiformis f. sp. tritici]KAI7938230.1 hypothetical protein MJO28_015150 [Puccinia striiformis f. sp. tritici]KAI9607887.1 hypothetical protein H4Q26_005337 [Puccinia striiformis f. sp. tritici PST-130]